jgi:hypothetical protein
MSLLKAILQTHTSLKNKLKVTTSHAAQKKITVNTLILPYDNLIMIKE